MMTTKVEFNIDKKGEFQTSLLAVNGQKFICAGEGCMTKRKCSPLQQLRVKMASPG
jgi:uncharacterized protein YegP (UPF0339 family)